MRSASIPHPTRSETGYSLVEMLVALLVLGIFAAMSATTVVAMNGSSVSSARLGTAAEGVQATANTLVRYLEGAVSPVDLSQGQLQLANGCGSLASAFVAGVPTAGQGSSFSFCSYGVSNSSGSPAVYSLRICDGGAPGLTLSGPGGTVPLDQTRVVCSTKSGSTTEPASYVAFCASLPSLPIAASLPTGCTFDPPGGSAEDP